MNETPTPGRWRVLAHEAGGSVEMRNRGVFDEIVVDDWLHIEQMDKRVWWMRVGDARILVSLEENNVTRVDVERGCYADVVGDTMELPNLLASDSR